ncbi:hypothetical protein [Xanthobacter tagetidis]|uniref:Alpha/beta hydrolase n=1 Tax=Xanthobacter tagetidis TaxID=60216 RepID=A0A3L7AEH5_9HYPH|nr:hypothetical protein [Xanthobacter tagetidis]MBB6305871.1 pimeloyl-ACP methyl ester carboxylesterase [Xanthobacter tagetidis]RLP78395.1 hypothetical protein D9R14_11335 [Xanthobacter tagetidis]
MWDGARWRTERRHLFLVPGYDPMPVDGHRRIFERELNRFRETWSLEEATCLEDAPRATPTGAAWSIAARGGNWRTGATFELLAWNDLVQADMARSPLSHMGGTLRALADMVTSGTLGRYFRSSPRYGFFFLFTYALTLLFWAIGAGLGLLAYDAAAPAIGTLGAALFGIALAAGAGAVLMRWPGRKFRLKQSLDLAEFSVDFVRGRHPAIDARVEAFGARIAAVAAAGEADEIVLVGHSLGAMLAVSALAYALKLNPALGRSVPVRLLTVGSTTAKFALHPAGGRLREAARIVAEAEAIGWLEIQARDDVVSFYRINPVTLEEARFAPLRTVTGDFSERPLIRAHPIRDMLSEATFARFRLDMMRLHCQYLLANDKRAGYDFFAVLASPLRFDLLAASANGLRTYLDARGLLMRPYSPADPGPWRAL